MTGKPRVLHILPTLGVGGAENMASHLMVGLAPDHDVTAVGLYPRGGTPTEARLHEGGVSVRHLGKRPGADPRMFAALARTLRELRPHVVHTHLSVLRYVYPVLWRHPVPAAVHTLHNTAEHEADLPGRVIQRLAFRRTVVPVAISAQGAASFQKVYGGDQPVVIPNSIPIGHYRRGPEAGRAWRERIGLPSDALVFICVGRLEEQKNPLGLLAAFASMPGENGHLVLLGDGLLRGQVEDWIRTAGLCHRIHVLGKRNDIPDCLAASDVFVLASHWEGNPLAVMEAMAAGLPVVGTAAGGVAELVTSGREGVLVPPGDLAGLARAMQSLAEDAAHRRNCGDAARERACREFPAETMTRRYAALYRSLLERNLRPATEDCSPFARPSARSGSL